jgi:hypothetical protein
VLWIPGSEDVDRRWLLRQDLGEVPQPWGLREHDEGAQEDGFKVKASKHTDTTVMEEKFPDEEEAEA